MPWVSGNIGISPWRENVGTASGWDITQGDVTFKGLDLTQKQSPLPLFTLAGGIIVFLFSFLGILTTKRFFGVPIFIGGLLAMVGAMWAYGGTWQANIYIEQSPQYITIGKGVIECLTAGVVDCIIGIISMALK